jgi:HlyD family secretion protein
MKKKIVVVVVVFTMILGVGWFLLKRGNSNLKFRTENVFMGDINQTVTATGTLNAVTTVLVGTQVSGTIKELFADFNSVVKKGQLLARIDPALFEAQTAQARANLLAAMANAEKATATLADAKRTYERNKTLIAKNLIAQSDLDTAQMHYESNLAQLSASKAQVDQAKAALMTAETNLRYTSIISPVNGMVISRSVDVGQTVAASFQTPTLFTIAEDMKLMQINTSVDEADIGKIRVGQSVAFTVDAFPETIFMGRVSEVRNAPTTIQNVVTYDVIVKVDNSNLKLKPGMTANVTITTVTKKQVLRVPNTALRVKLPGQDPERSGLSVSAQGQSLSGVWVLANGRPKRVRLTTGISDGMFTEILESELQEGKEVIVEVTGTDKKRYDAALPPGPGFFR